MKASTDSKLDDGIILTCHLEIKFLFIKGGLVYGPLNLQDTSTPNKIVAQAYKFLEQNLVTGFNGEFGVNYSFRNPNANKYGPSQWFWGISLYYSLNNDRFRGSSNYLGQEGLQPFYC